MRIASIVGVVFLFFQEGNAFVAPSSSSPLRQHQHAMLLSVMKERKFGQRLEPLFSEMEERSYSSSSSRVAIETAELPSPTKEEATFGVVESGVVAPSTGLEEIKPILTTALLITASTIGAGSLVLPEVAAKPGMAISTALFTASYFANLISGLIVAEVAIRQKEFSGQDVPSSFKEFAEVNLQSKTAGTVISALSLFTNSCIMTFGFTRMGEFASSSFGLLGDSFVATLGLAALLGILGTTQTGQRLSEISSAIVAILFACFAGVLLPGIANVADPMGTMMNPGTMANENLADGMSIAFPIMVTTLVFQNIVPSVTKILNYNRIKTAIAMALGSFIPFALYVAWCFACIGGGITVGASPLENPFLLGFSVAATIGSCLGCTMSLSEEIETFLPQNNNNNNNNDDDDVMITRADGSKEEEEEESKVISSDQQIYSLPSVMIGVGFPLCTTYALTHGLGWDLTIPLKLAGSYSSPSLYGIIPPIMAWTQMKRFEQENNNNNQVRDQQSSSLVPGGVVTLGALSLAATALIIHELSIDLGGTLF